MEALILANSNCSMLNVNGHTSLDVASLDGHAQVSCCCVCVCKQWSCSEGGCTGKCQNMYWIEITLHGHLVDVPGLM